jgi:hypothetical protein
MPFIHVSFAIPSAIDFPDPSVKAVHVMLGVVIVPVWRLMKARNRPPLINMERIFKLLS